MTYGKAEQRTDLSFTKTMLAHRLSFYGLHRYTVTPILRKHWKS